MVEIVYICFMLIRNTKRELSEDEFLHLKIMVREAEERLNQVRDLYHRLLSEYEDVVKDYQLQSFFHEPEVIISEVNNKNTGHKWTGRVRIPKELILDPKKLDQRVYLMFNICEGGKFESKDDDVLLEMAKVKAKEKIIEKTLKKS